MIFRQGVDMIAIADQQLVQPVESIAASNGRPSAFASVGFSG